MSEKKRESSGFFIKQRAFLKVYILTNIEKGRCYGLQIHEDLLQEFEDLGYVPQFSEIYKALYELEDEEEILTKFKIKVEGSKRKEVVVYQIKDKDKAKAYKKLVKADLDRCEQLVRKALHDNYA